MSKAPKFVKQKHFHLRFSSVLETSELKCTLSYHTRAKFTHVRQSEAFVKHSKNSPLHEEIRERRKEGKVGGSMEELEEWEGKGGTED